MLPEKPPLSIPEQIKLLRDRGLIITNEETAIKLLSNINYYRLSAYFKTFQKDDKFFEGTKTEDIILLYEFDRQLRNKLISAIDIIETLIKTKIAYIMGLEYGPFSYRDINNYIKEGNDKSKYWVKFKNWLSSCEQHIHKNKPETFIKYHYDKHNCELYIWKFVEVISFSMMSKMFSNLKNEIQKKISKEFKYSTTFMEGILYSLTIIRNICAHNLRLWNRILKSKITVKNTKFKEFEANKVGIYIFIINDVLTKLYYDKEFTNMWKKEMEILIDNHPEVPNFWESIGLLENWKENPLWRGEI